MYAIQGIVAWVSSRWHLCGVLEVEVGCEGFKEVPWKHCLYAKERVSGPVMVHLWLLSIPIMMLMPMKALISSGVVGYHLQSGFTLCLCSAYRLVWFDSSWKKSGPQIRWK